MNETIRDLETNLENAVDPHQKIDLMNSLAELVCATDPQRAAELSRKAHELATTGEFASQPYRAGAALAALNLGMLNSDSNYELALYYLLEARLNFENLNNQDRMVETLNLISRVYIYTADYSRALETLLTQLSITDRSPANTYRPDTLNNIGLVYLKLHDLSSAFIYLIKANQAAQEISNNRVIADSLRNLCSLACQQQDYQKAIDYGQKSLALYQEMKNLTGEVDALLSLGETYAALGEYGQANQHFNRALQIAYSLAHPRLVMESQIKVGSIHLQQGQSRAAESAYLQALDIAEELKVLQSQYVCHQALAEIYKRQSNWEHALYHFEQFHTLKESVYNEQTHRRIRNYEISYQVEVARREAEIQEYRNIALQREIAEQARAEQALSQVNAELRARIQERDDLIQELEAFSHTVAHDLKNPLQTLTFSAQILLRTISPENSGLAGYAQTILDTCKSMNTIIDELLLLASVRREDILPQPVEMKSVIDQALKRLDALVQEHQPVIQLSGEFPEALGYAPWLEDVWANLIANAIQYGGTPPLIIISADQQPDSMVRFSIQDNGNGIKPEDQESLFTAFSQGRKSGRRGHGLGLSIVQRIVSKLGGEVMVQSTNEPGMGSVFSFTLPQNTK